MIPGERKGLLVQAEQTSADASTCCVRTHNNRSNREEHEGVLPEERLHVLLGDLLHFPLGLHGADVDSFPDSLHPAESDPNSSLRA